MGKVGEILAPILGGLVAATSPQAAHGVGTALDIGISMREARRRREAEAQAAARQGRVGAFLSNLPDDPEVPEMSAAREIARAGDVETATMLYREGATARSRRAQTAAEEKNRGSAIAALVDAATAVEPPLGGGPPKPPSRRQSVIRALAPLAPASAASMAVAAEEGYPPPEGPRLVHRVGKQGEGLYRWSPEEGGWVFDSPIQAKPPGAARLVETVDEQGRLVRRWVKEGEVPPPPPPLRPPREEDPAAEYNRLVTAEQSARARLAKAREADLQGWKEDWKARTGFLGQALTRAPVEGPKSELTTQAEQELAAIEAALGEVAGRLRAGRTATPTASGVPAASHRQGPPPKTWGELKERRKR